MADAMWWTPETSQSLTDILGGNWLLDEAADGELVIHTGYVVAHDAGDLMQLAPIGDR